MSYQVKEKYKGKVLVTKVLDEVVNLGGFDYTKAIPETKSKPEQEVVIPAAKQKHLKAYFELGTQRLIEKVQKKKNNNESTDSDENKAG